VSVPVSLAERFLLHKALILRRIFDKKTVPMDTLLKSLEDDEALVREKAPHLYYADFWTDFRFDIDECVGDGLIEWATPISAGNTLRRTRLGNQFMRTLEPRLKDNIDDMPMSGDGLLDYLAYM
jgi:hypothetical protein